MTLFYDEYVLKYCVYSSWYWFQVTSSNGVWGLSIAKVGHSDAGSYECQTNSEVKNSVQVKLNVKGNFYLRKIE